MNAVLRIRQAKINPSPMTPGGAPTGTRQALFRSDDSGRPAIDEGERECMKNRLRILLLVLLTATAASASPRDFPRPTGLKGDVAFWKRIYSEVGTDAGLLHDAKNLSIVYEVIEFPQGLSTRSRERHTEKRRKFYRKILLHLATGKRTGLSRVENHVLTLLGDGVSNTQIRKSADQLRFQLGQANKFRDGIVRSGAFKPFILGILRDQNLPLEIANLPHVESSYSPTVYSRVGAAGLWQFTRSTGRRFMRIDHVIDERLDPYRASIAAARLLEQNYRVTGSWPLAITAYNHGASGMRRAARKLGTKDITKIVRNYRSRTFGFASRNFYVEFLAANAVASNSDFYFGPLVLDRPIRFEEIDLPFHVKPKSLASAVGIDLETLRKANPSLRAPIWSGAKYIPKGFSIRVPRASLPRPLRDGIAGIPKKERHARQTRDVEYTVRRGDTLSKIANRHRVRISELIALNGLKNRHRIRVGQKLRLPSDSARNKPSKNPATIKPTRSRAKPKSPAELPEDDFYLVRRGDNLTRIAEQFGLSLPELVAMNSLKSRNRLAIGQRLQVIPIEAASSQSRTASQAKIIRSTSRKIDAGGGGEKNMSHEKSPEIQDESPIEPGPGLLADPSDYTVADDGTIRVQPNETLGHYAEWLGLRAKRLRSINSLRYGQPVIVDQKLLLDFSKGRPDDFERVRIEYHRALQEAFLRGGRSKEP